MDLDTLITDFRSPLIALMSAWGASPQDAVELAQDTFSEAYLGRERFKGDWKDVGAVGAWLRGIAVNLFHAGRRKGSAGGRLVSLDEAREATRAEPTDSLENREQQAILRSALDQLKAPWRTVLMMRYVDGSSLAVIGSLLGLTERAVEGRLLRARVALKKQLELATRVDKQS